jgi:hypothetical protein
VICAPLLQLGRMGRLRSLTASFPGNFPGNMAPPPWLSSLTALTRIEANLQLSPVNVAVLAALPALRRLEGVTWTAGGGGALPAACCPGVLVLDNVRVHHSGLPSLAAAFPGLRDAINMEVVDGDDDDDDDDGDDGSDDDGGDGDEDEDEDDDEAPHPAAMPAAPAPWRRLQTLHIEGFELLQERHFMPTVKALLSLLRGATKLTTLRLTSVPLSEENEDTWGAAEPHWGDAEVWALLAYVPLSLESLELYPLAALTDGAFADCPCRPALKTLQLLWLEPPELTPGGLLALGRALPGLQSLYIYADEEAGGYDEEDTQSAWVRQLDALGGGAQPAVGSGNALLPAIRRALAREAAAGARLA